MTRHVHRPEYSDRFHNPIEAMTALSEKMGTVSNPRPEKLYRCPLCLDSGWTEADDDGRGTVTRCERGCTPPEKHTRRPEPEKPEGAVTIQ